MTDEVMQKLRAVHAKELVALVERLHKVPTRGSYNQTLGRKTEGQYEIKQKIQTTIKVMNDLEALAEGKSLSDDSELVL